ncbi:MAG: MFS transporter [Gaiellaceae bacterium]
MSGDDLREAGRLGPAPPVPEPGRVRAVLRLAAIDVGPLRRHRDFRLLFVGMGVSNFGSMITYVALPYQVFQLTGSSLAVGLMSLAELGPLLVTSFVGGALADAFDRRRLVQLAELLLAACAGVLALNSWLWDPRVWILFVVGAAMAGLDGIQRPPLDALIPRLVDREELIAASALDSFRANLGWVAGPAVAGVLIAVLGLPLTYLIDVATFGVSLVALGLMRAVPPPPGAERPSLRGIVESFRYAMGRPELVGTYGVDMIAMFFGIPIALFPAFAEEFGGAGALGLLYAAPSVGALLATATSGWTGRIQRHGVAVCWAAAGWGVAITALGFAPNLALALLALTLAGAADMVSGIFRTTIWNTTIPDHLRGRLAGIEQVSYSAGPLLGNLESGVVAAFAGVRASIVSGGVLCVAGVAVAALALPAFRRYDARDHLTAPPAEPARS